MTADFNWQKLQNGSDIRGVALEGVPGETVNLTAAVVERLGGAFAGWLAEAADKPTTALRVALGRDSRLSGPDLLQAAIAGLTAAGVSVYDFGLASTPAMFGSTIDPELQCDGAIMLTASHLPFNRNGLKFFTREGGLNKGDIAAILALAGTGDLATAATPGNVEQRDFISIYAAGFVAQIREAIRDPDNYDRPLSGLKIVVDAGNGAGGFYVDKVLQPLGADTTGSQFLDPDGTFPNHIPNPEDKDAIAAIRQAVLERQADFGIIFDTDVDRAAAVDRSGKELNRNRLIALMAAIVLQEHPGSTIVTDSITSDGLGRFIEAELGGVHHRFKRGYKNVISEAQRLNAEGQESWLAIETSGHGAMKENYFLDDGAYLITKLVIELARWHRQGKSLTEAIAKLQEPVESEEVRLKIGLEDFKPYANTAIEKLQAFAASQEDWQIVPKNYEGVRVACTAAAEDGWFLLRLSLHDPVIPLNIESNVAGGAAKIAARLREFLQSFEALDVTVFDRLLAG